MTPHMHLRGKAFKYVLTYPDGRSEELLTVPKYDFNWQLSYILDKPRQIPAGSKIEATADAGDPGRIPPDRLGSQSDRQSTAVPAACPALRSLRAASDK